ncbi:hypothetical protein [Halalkalibacter akibai]|uniref:Uncharacterized protein n=1 Tax=Halalkalibacter akibai (strain ATCC 43226 / DSM 21942 / CIP 109018 / JCM 9157 / 1139) TaxID=1236973 RepID=W4QMW0_HALA3|nr:hypothetical protein [Halalkalibacter akibai]GAE33257.1 hypothetical protein JCM9157_251 [Halalkalibacter akibai JCM 9157]
MIRSFWQALISSTLVFLLYGFGIVAYGYYQTTRYVPDILSEYENVSYLQNEIAFGAVGSPTQYIWTYLGLFVLFFIFFIIKNSEKKK